MEMLKKYGLLGIGGLLGFFLAKKIVSMIFNR